jgi:hypothetical protein
LWRITSSASASDGNSRSGSKARTSLSMLFPLSMALQ